MIDNDNIRSVVISGLKEYLGIPMIMSNQNNTPPNYPYASYTVITLENANNGTWGVYKDDIDRLPVKQTWSITIQSDDEDESVKYATMARDYLKHIGTCYLNDNNVIVESVTDITNRDNIISIEYEYKNGFDVVFWLMNEVKNPIESIGKIEKLNLKEE